jgi:hypothetical protein
MTPARIVLLALALLLPTSTLRAQSGAPIEWGVDAAVTVSFDPTVTIVSIPRSHVRAGFFISPSLELEPRFGLVSVSASGDRVTQTQLELGMLLHFDTSRLDTQPYLRPFVGLQSVSGAGPSSTNGDVGVGLGIKIPIGSRFAFRPEANYRHVFGDVDDDQFQVLAGFSVYSH